MSFFRGALSGLGVAAFALCALVFVADRPSRSASTLVPSTGLKLTIPYNTPSPYVAPLWLGIETGIFVRYGIEASVVGPMASPSVVASMLSGETPIAFVGPDAIIAADLNGGDIKVLGAAAPVVFSMYVSQNIRSAADLKGKKIGITRFGTTTDYVTRYILRKLGLKPDEDVSLVPLDVVSNMVTAMVAGAVDGGMLADDYVIVAAKQLGPFHPLASMADYDIVIPSSPLMGKESWFKSHPNDALNVARAYAEGIATVFKDKNATMAAIAKYTKTTDPGMLAQSHALLLKVLPKAPVPKPSDLATIMGASTKPEVRAANPAQFIEPSFMNELVRDGFIDNLYK